MSSQLIVPSWSLEGIREEVELYKDGDSFLRRMANHYGLRSVEFVKVDEAHTLAVDGFDGYRRHSGEEYVEHVRATANIAFYRGDRSHTSIIERLLHDTLEEVDEATTYELYRRFGAVVTYTVCGVTTPTIRYPSGLNKKERRRFKQRQKFGKVVRHGRRAMLVKCDDRSHNMLTLWGSPKEKRRKIIETMEWVIPMSVRLENVFLLELLVAACAEQLERLHVDDWRSGTA